MKEKIKVRDLCSEYPLVAKSRPFSETIASNVFNINAITPYIQSDILESRYGIPIDQKYVDFSNDYLENFHEYGRNEKYLLNKIYNSDLNLLFIVGGIGTGKSYFLKYFREIIFHKRKHLCTNQCKTKGCFILINFDEQLCKSFSSRDEQHIHNDICDLISKQIATQTSKFFELPEELTTIWDEILSENELNRVFLNIYIRLRAEEALDYKKYDKESNFIIRQSIYKDIILKHDDFLVYLSGILQHIARKHFKHLKCFFIAIDNLDRVSPLVQHIAKSIMKLFFKITPNISGIVTLRQTTYRGLIAEGYSNIPSEVAAHCGPSILEVVSMRLNLLLEDTSKYTKGIQMDKDLLNNFKKNIYTLKTHITRKVSMDFYKSICGNSIRKALVISERLLLNSAYDIFAEKDIERHEMLRALMINGDDRYQWKHDNEIDNIFDVNGVIQGHSLIKLRILRALANKKENGLELGTLVELLKAFGYTFELVQAALNDLLSIAKRLTWSNAVKEFESLSMMFQFATSKLYISSAGRGYQNWLFNNPLYFQEVMLDIYVDPDIFGKGWNYNNFNDRVNLMKLFCKELIREDIEEVELFIAANDLETLEKYWNDSHLISLEILSGLKNVLHKIIDRRIEQDVLSKQDQLKFKDEMDKIFYEYQDFAEYQFRNIIAKKTKPILTKQGFPNILKE